MSKKYFLMRICMLCFVFFGLHISHSHAAEDFRAVEETGSVGLHVSQGRLLQLPQSVTSVLVADPKIASFQTPSASSLFVFGEGVGETSLYALGADNQVVMAVKLVVSHDLNKISEKMKAQYPNAAIELIPASTTGVIVRGTVQTPLDAARVMESVRAALVSEGGNSTAGNASAAGGSAGGGSTGAGSSATSVSVINQLQVALSAQVNIRVRVVEVARSLSYNLGMNWDSVFGSDKFRIATGGLGSLYDATEAFSATGGVASQTMAGQLIRSPNVLGFTDGNLTGLIKALSEEGMATVLAEPNLTAMSGETAAFAAGGDVPVVVITANNVSIDFRSYGVILRMTPTVLSENRISLHVAPEVSDLSDEGAVTLASGSTIPAFKIRRADTTVELASGQSFALAGMLRSVTSQQVNSVPGLSSIPLLGRLFESEESVQEESELVIIATAYIVEPVHDGDLQVPGKNISALKSKFLEPVTAGYLF